MTIERPTLPDYHPDFALTCEEALAEGFYGVVEQNRGHDWTGDESALWRLRRENVSCPTENRVEESGANPGKKAKEIKTAK